LRSEGTRRGVLGLTLYIAVLSIPREVALRDALSRQI
jgi:hypothetical protein